MLVQVYGREVVSRKYVYECFKRFREGKETTNDVSHSGTPSTSWTQKLIENVRLIAEELGNSKDTANRSSAMIWVSGRSAPGLCRTSLQTSRRQNGWKLLETLFSTLYEDPLLLKNMVTGDETWCYQFDPESKWQSMASCSPTSSRPRKIHLQNSKFKTLLIAFFDNKGIIHKEFVHAGETINAAFNQAVSNWLLQRIQRVRPELHRTGKCMLLHDNAPVPSAIRMRQFLAEKMIAVLDHPPYCRDLAPVDFFLFSPCEGVHKRCTFCGRECHKKSETAVLRWIPQEAFAYCFRNMYERCQTCIVADGDYFER